MHQVPSVPAHRCSISGVTGCRFRLLAAAAELLPLPASLTSLPSAPPPPLLLMLLVMLLLPCCCMPEVSGLRWAGCYAGAARGAGQLSGSGSGGYAEAAAAEEHARQLYVQLQAPSHLWPATGGTPQQDATDKAA